MKTLRSICPGADFVEVGRTPRDLTDPHPLRAVSICSCYPRYYFDISNRRTHPYQKKKMKKKKKSELYTGVKKKNKKKTAPNPPPPVPIQKFIFSHSSETYLVKEDSKGPVQFRHLWFVL